MAYGLTKSANLVSASSQVFTAVDSASLSITGNLTLECWVRFTSVASSMAFASKGDLGVLAGSYAFGYTGTHLRFYHSDGSTYADLFVAWSPSAGVWYHVAVVFNTSTVVKFFVDGVQQGADQTGKASLSDDACPFMIGGYAVSCGGGGVGTMNGDISLMRVWSTTRIASDFSTNQCSVLGATTNLAAEWTLNDVLTDNSGNANTLTNVNAATFTTALPSVCAVVGPVNLKSLNTNLKANIKSVNTNPIANIKSLNTNV